MARNNKNETPVEEVGEAPEGTSVEPVDETPVEEPKTKTKKTVVEFVKHFMPYAKGDVAGFDKKEADKLIELKVAKLVK